MATTYDANKMVAMILGAVLVLVGILGFVPALVTEGGLLLGIFGINTLHNLIHVATGAVLLAAAYLAAGAYARPTNITLGVVYLLVAVLGFVAPAFMNVLINSQPIALNPDAFLHLLLGVVLVGAAFMKTETTRPSPGARV